MKSFRRGLMWRVGHGENINLWVDNWILSVNNKKPLLCLETPKPSWVAKLINFENKDWDRPKLHRLFMASDVSKILKLKISFRLPPDDFYWGPTRSGEFSVKSCYFLTENVRFAGKHVPSSSSDISVAFKKIWEVSLPLKLKHFGWKMIKGILPTASALLRWENNDQW
ncbi:Ribonuclease H-like superfamily protein [Euphorbia peplus]|nr:Ribonuclease H-like superfamily protein [Euphorbia peplus]